MNNLFTIGYANKTIDEFIEILYNNKINCVVDVRSIPFSKQFPLYNENNIKKVLMENNIKYLSFKNEFGARRSEDELYSCVTTIENEIIEVVDFNKVWKSQSFLLGINRIKEGLYKGYKICFMCSEKQAYDCHRGVMISEYFYKFMNINVIHLIDMEYFYEHEKFIDFYRKIYEEEKNKFIKRNEKFLLYDGDLFNDDDSKVIKKWKKFFDEFSYEKGFVLSNYKIGYKKGVDEDE